MSNLGSTKEIANGISSESIEGEVLELQMLTQEAVNELIRGFTAPITCQLEQLTRLVQGMTASRHSNFYPRTELGTTPGTVLPQFDTHGYFICQNKYFKEVENRVPKLSKETMQALRKLTNFCTFLKKSYQRRKIARNTLHILLVLVNPQSFYLEHFFHNFEFSEEIVKSKSLILTSSFNTLIFKFSIFKMSFGTVFDNFSADR